MPNDAPGLEPERGRGSTGRPGEKQVTASNQVTAFEVLLQAHRELGRLATLDVYLHLFPECRREIPRRLAEAVEEMDARKGPIREGRCIRHYKLRRCLGRGGFARVWLADDMSLGRQVAIKIIVVRAEADETLRRFEREAELLARARHPNICAVYDAFIDHELLCIVMGFIDGRSLEDCLSDGAAMPASSGGSEADCAASVPWPAKVRSRAEIDFVLRYFETALAAMHAAHENGIVHRDLKPGNLMVGTDGEPTVLDFGLARHSGESSITESGVTLGTPTAMSPEQLATGDAEVDRRTDVWSLGVCLYYAVAGFRPFEAPTREGLFRAIAHDDPPPLPKEVTRACPGLKVVLDTALAKHQHERYQTTAAFAEDLRRLRLHKPILARRPSLARRLQLWVQREPRFVTALGALLLILGAGLVVSWTLLGEVREKEGETNDANKSLKASQANNHFGIAREAMINGNWTLAAANFDLSLESGYPDRASVILGKVEALSNDRKAGEARKLLEELSIDELSGPNQARYRLWRNELITSPDKGQAARREEARLLSDLEGFAPADTAYLKAVAATTMEEADSWLVRSLEKDARHALSTVARAGVLIFMGRTDDGAILIDRWTTVWPDDPRLPMFRELHRQMKAIIDGSAIPEEQNDLDVLGPFELVVECARLLASCLGRSINAGESAWNGSVEVPISSIIKIVDNIRKTRKTDAAFGTTEIVLPACTDAFLVTMRSLIDSILNSAPPAERIILSMILKKAKGSLPEPGNPSLDGLSLALSGTLKWIKQSDVQGALIDFSAGIKAMSFLGELSRDACRVMLVMLLADSGQKGNALRDQIPEEFRSVTVESLRRLTKLRLGNFVVHGMSNTAFRVGSQTSGSEIFEWLYANHTKNFFILHNYAMHLERQGAYATALRIIEEAINAHDPPRQESILVRNRILESMRNIKAPEPK